MMNSTQKTSTSSFQIYQTSQMQLADLEAKVKLLENLVKALANPILSRVEKLESRLSEGFMLKYKRPGKEDYDGLGVVLTDIYERLNKIEEYTK